MTDPVDPPPAASANDVLPTPPSQSPTPAQPTTTGDKLDVGCLVLLGVSLLGTAAIPAALLLGGAPVIIPGLCLLVIGFFTPLLNPAERMSPGKRWAGRGVVFCVLCGLLLAGAWYLLLREGSDMRIE